MDLIGFDWIVYIVRDIPAFVMYCVYGASPSSVLIESTDSMIIILRQAFWPRVGLP